MSSATLAPNVAVPGVASLAAAGTASTRDAFSVLLAACQDGQDRSAELFAAFAFAAAAAARGRLIIAGAPSLPADLDLGEGTSSGAAGEPDPGKLADVLASLAARLAGRLSSAARESADPGDRDACQDAADQAARVCEILEPGTP